MKTILAIICSLVLGVAAGWIGARRYSSKEVYEATLDNIRESARHSEQESLNRHNMDLMVLTLIEGGEHDRVKLVLARSLASYYRTFHDSQPERPATRQLIENIQAASEKLPSLKEALEAPAK
jgi:hypothetical protein